MNGVNKVIGWKAVDQKEGMTLDEVAKWVQRCLRENVPGDTHVRSMTGIRKQQLQTIQVQVQEEDE
jgi:hypothetical protein